MPTQHCECGAKYRFPETAIGKRAKCKKCGTVITLQDEEDDGILALAPEDPSPTPGAEPPAMPVQGEVSRPGGSVDPRSADRTSTPADGAVIGKRGYFTDVLWTFLFPANPASLIPFVFIWGFMAAAPIVNYLPFGGIIAAFFRMMVALLVAAWFAAFQLEVLSSVATGEDDLPRLGIESGMAFDLLITLFKWVGSWILVLLPAFAYIMIQLRQGTFTGRDVVGMFSGGTASMMQNPAAPLVFKVLVCAGLFIWPIVVLCIALDSFAVLYRVDLVVLTIIKTLPIYALTVALLYGAVAVEYAIEYAVVLAAWTGPGSGGTFTTRIIVNIAVTGVHVYMSIVVMRLIGLYYVHGKKRFAWSWE